MLKSVTRRRLIKGLGALALLPLVPTLSFAKQSNNYFLHGVASGDPDNNSVVLWTRLTSIEALLDGIWEVAIDEDFKKVVAKGKYKTNQVVDYTVKVVADGLSPNTNYFYRFIYQNIASSTGRTKTLTSGHIEKLGLAVASCSNYAFGFFNAYDAIAKDDEIDVVLHLGDYIYEYGVDGWGGNVGRQINRSHIPSHEIKTLSDYRQRHAQYKADKSSQRMHERHPLIVIWDDHESANNPWTDGAENHQSATEGNWQARRAASIQAYFEWMPIREPSDGVSHLEYWRTYNFGDLANITTLETRHTGRSEQINYLEHLSAIKNDLDRQVFMDNVIGNPSRNMLSKEMEHFLSDSLVKAKKNQRWKLIANQIPMARTHVPVLNDPIFKTILEEKDTPLAKEWAVATRLGELNLPFYMDTWDGYSAARQRFYETCQHAGITDLIVLTGDSHAFWQNQLFDNNGTEMGLELGTTGISAPGDFLRLGKKCSDFLDKSIAQHNKEVLWTNNSHNGYIKLVMTHEKAKADFVSVSTVIDENYETKLVRSIEIAMQDNKLIY